jgi:hypothetical protein
MESLIKRSIPDYIILDYFGFCFLILAKYNPKSGMLPHLP